MYETSYRWSIVTMTPFCVVSKKLAADYESKAYLRASDLEQSFISARMARRFSRFDTIHERNRRTEDERTELPQHASHFAQQNRK